MAANIAVPVLDAPAKSIQTAAVRVRVGITHSLESYSRDGKK